MPPTPHPPKLIISVCLCTEVITYYLLHIGPCLAPNFINHVHSYPPLTQKNFPPLAAECENIQMKEE